MSLSSLVKNEPTLKLAFSIYHFSPDQIGVKQHVQPQYEALYAMINYYVYCPDNFVHVYYNVFYLFNIQLVCNCIVLLLRIL